MQTIVPATFGCYPIGMPKLLARLSVVYMATNILTGDRYIGFTSRPFGRRKSDHIKGAINGYAPGRFAAAIRTYGAAAFKWKILSTFATAHGACAEETRLIRTLKPEYNATFGGGAYVPHVLSDEVKGRLRCLGHKNIATWMKFAPLGPAASARRVVCLDDGKVYPSASAAAAAYGAEKSAVIEVCLRRSFRRLAVGRVFRYEGDHQGGAEEAAIVKNIARKGGNNPYKGVYRHFSEGRDTGRYRARIATGGRGNCIKHSLGIFETAEDAREAVEEARQAIAAGKFP